MTRRGRRRGEGVMVSTDCAVAFIYSSPEVDFQYCNSALFFSIEVRRFYTAKTTTVSVERTTLQSDKKRRCKLANGERRFGCLMLTFPPIVNLPQDFEGCESGLFSLYQASVTWKDSPSQHHFTHVARGVMPGSYHGLFWIPLDEQRRPPHSDKQAREKSPNRRQ